MRTLGAFLAILVVGVVACSESISGPGGSGGTASSSTTVMGTGGLGGCAAQLLTADCVGPCGLYGPTCVNEQIQCIPPPGCGGIACGGIGGNVPCPTGTTCVDDPTDDCDPAKGGADCGGICVVPDGTASCGGFGNLPCPSGQTCVDDPRDDCDPAKGGADCPGICTL